ncbi:alpha/beta hydrolase [Litorilituus sediminis]|uniref:Alpha/beta hydrolase n=1 Tax=Litorilituus sediminis TaxID=718192 RepID=A0A4P6P449_9GAMM|nr:hypothetical protein [Litorilituus sediminis]QBG36163.1 hypothetical protein EMK97_10785 [Litorilituus sediminis]
MANQFVNKVTLSVISLFLSASIFTAYANSEQQAYSEVVKIKASEDYDFLLTADYLFQTAPMRQQTAEQAARAGVIILHDCQADRSRYKDLANEIALQELHTLSLDFRGFGKSVAMGFSELEIKKQAKDIVSYQSEVALLTSYWPQDILAAYQWLRTKVHKNKGVAVVASGCAAPYAVALAEQIHVSALVLITPEMTFADIERYKNLIDIPTYFIGSAQHMATIKVTQELFNWNGAKQSKMQTFKGDRTNRQLLFANESLTQDIAQWLKFALR